jgi:hypothetical protein
MEARYKLPDFIREPFESYRARRNAYLTSHQLIDAMRCPLTYKRKAEGLIVDAPRDYFVTGAAAHCLINEGIEAFEAQYVVGGPINEKTGRPYGDETKAFKEWAAAQTRQVISFEAYDLVCRLECAVRSHPIAADILSEGVAEGVLRNDCGTHKEQIRIDWFSRRYGIVDLKTCANLDEFERQVDEFGYVDQLAFYRRNVWRKTGDWVECRLIGVEKKEPHRVGVWLISPAKLDEADGRAAGACRDLHAYRMTDVWPTRFEQERTI